MNEIRIRQKTKLLEFDADNYTITGCIDNPVSGSDYILDKELKTKLFRSKAKVHYLSNPIDDMEPSYPVGNIEWVKWKDDSLIFKLKLDENAFCGEIIRGEKGCIAELDIGVTEHEKIIKEIIVNSLDLIDDRV